MKKKVSIILFVIMFLVWHASWAQESAAPSLERTVQFLNKMIHEHNDEEIKFKSSERRPGKDHDSSMTHSFKGFDFRASGSDCSFSADGASLSFGSVRKVKVISMVDYLDSIRFKTGIGDAWRYTDTEPRLFIVMLSIPNSGVDVIRRDGGIVTDGGIDFVAFHVEDVNFVFWDEEDAGRVARAFNHAAELCGAGAGDPF